MICRLLSSDPNLCFDKVQEKISIFSENEYLLEVTSNQTSLQQHSRKRPSILTAFKLCCVLRQARLLSVWLVAGPCLRHCRLTAVPKRIQYVADYYYYVPPAPPPLRGFPLPGLAACVRATAGFQIYNLGFFKLQLRNL